VKEREHKIAAIQNQCRRLREVEILELQKVARTIGPFLASWSGVPWSEILFFRVFSVRFQERFRSRFRSRCTLKVWQRFRCTLKVCKVLQTPYRR
jgi:hypothetical protein